MKKLFFAVTVCSVLGNSTVLAERERRISVIPGYVSHGINVYNDQAIADYSQASPLVPWLQPNPLVKEIGALNEGGEDPHVITEETDRSLPVATIRSFFDFFNFGGSVNPDVFNQPLDAIGSNFFGFTQPDERVPMVPFESAAASDLYAGKGTNARPTVGDWEEISGQIHVHCRADGTAKARVTVRDAFPNAVYTLWDVGALSPMTPDEQGYGVPFGGLPNIVLTDKRGCGYKEVELPVCPTRRCEAGTESCSSYVSAFYHWDGQVYGGSPAGTFAGAPVGAVAANHIVWPMSGTPLLEPQNEFRPRRPGCRPRF